MRRILLFCFLLNSLNYASVIAQGINLGIPPIRNFEKKNYKAGTQNWDIAQDKRGVIYFANNDGLLEFNGLRWNCFPISNHTIVRSIGIAEDGKIFAGAQSEFGYFFPGSNGELSYRSLTKLLPKTLQNFEDVWDICFLNGDIFFRTNHIIFQYSKGKLQTHQFESAITAMFSVDNEVFLQQNLHELYHFKNNRFEKIGDYVDIKSTITGMLPWKNDTILIATLKNGIFYKNNKAFGVWKTSNDQLLKDKRIYTSCGLSGNQIALGTSSDGLIIIDQNHRICRHLSKKTGLQNNNILCTFQDKNSNIWLGLDNGIDFTMPNSSFSTILPEKDIQGTGYSVCIFKDKLYLGASDGLYEAPWQSFYDPNKSNYFRKIKSTDGQVWGLKEIDDNLLIGHHEGTFNLRNGQTTLLSSEPGAWTFIKVNSDTVVGGTYNGLILYTKSGGEWKFKKKLKGLNESCRVMVKDIDGYLWISHPYRGIYRINFSKDPAKEIDVKFYDSKNGLPSNLNNYVFQISGRAVFATEKGIFRFDNKLEIFKPDLDFKKQIGASERIKYLKEDSKGNIWYVSQSEVGLLLVNDLGLRKETKKKVFRELDNKLVGGFEFVYPVDENNIFFGSEQGFIHYNGSSSKSKESTFQVIISQIYASGERDSLIFGGFFVDKNKIYEEQSNLLTPSLKSNLNNLNFNFAATDFQDPTLIEYRTMLLGSDSKWSEWSTESNKNFSNLRPGAYTFQVQARNSDNIISKVATYSFRIIPPWYLSKTAIFLYLILLLAGIGGFHVYQKQKFRHEKEILQASHAEKEAQHLKQVEITKAALAQTQNDKLAAEISFKNKELASSTLHLVQKGEILLTIKNALNNMLEKSVNAEVKKEIQQLINLLNFDVNLDEDWEQFAFHFDQVHVDFLKRLREKFPQLSANDEKLCAYLRLNLSTKETAQLLNISVRGVEVSRYRLRKKLKLPNDVHLAEFMIHV